jgi:hypothetical protein
MNKSAIGNFVLDTVSKALDKMTHELESVTKRWQQREISNVRITIFLTTPTRPEKAKQLESQFAYLQILNQFANRTPNGKLGRDGRYVRPNAE